MRKKQQLHSTIRTCSKCGEEKGIADFYIRSDNGYPHSHCKACVNQATGEYAKRSRGEGKLVRYYREKYKRQRIRIIDKFGNVCSVCGCSFPPPVYDFHHLDPTEKEFNIGSLTGCSDEIIDKELEKCILVCSNCHRLIHYVEGYQHALDMTREVPN